ncbi:MAG: tyrosine-protein phosphatase, partial [Eubacteriaceae bacterium]|nr:tyrosine-protein phosphatase [Eubacteriaceae bacterium]
MKNNGKRLICALALLLAFMLAAGGCGAKKEEEAPLSVTGVGVIHETEFGGVYIKLTIDGFNALGFEYGDSVDVVFSGGYALEDIPYYNGYYVEAGEPLLVAYPGYEYIKAAVNYGEDLYVTADLDTDSTADITLKEKGKYLDIQTVSDIHYKDIREEFPSDEVFANFREVTAGSIGEKTLYRGASPCDNQHQRAPYSDLLIGQAGVRCILDLADSEAKIEKYIASDDFSSPCFLSLYNEGKVIPVALSMNFTSDSFAASLAEGLILMSQQEGPYYVHCTEGKDRTGFVCMLLEALAGASWQEIADDYMITYDNYYRISPENEREKYDLILEKNLLTMVRFLVGDPGADPASLDLSGYAR